MTATIKVTSNMKYIPYHIKIIQLMNLLNEKTGEFVPLSQYILQPFELNVGYFSAKPKILEDKMIPETLVSIKIAKKHLDTTEMKDRIVKETLDELCLYLASNSGSVSFPEMAIPAAHVLKKFKKNSGNQNYKKMMTHVLEVIDLNSDFIKSKRTVFFVKEKNSLKSDNLKKWAMFIRKQGKKDGGETPLDREKKKILKLRLEQDLMKQTDILGK